METITNENKAIGNKAIAEFMGYKLITPEMRGENSKMKCSYWQKNYPNEHNILCGENGLSYQFSWDWLKPVIDKIIGISCLKGLKEKCSTYELCQIVIISDMWIGINIMEAWKLVVDFINFYNSDECTFKIK